MAGALEDLSDELKNKYPTGTWRTMINLEAPYRAKLKKAPYKQQNGIVKVPARLSAAWNVSVIADSADMPAIQDPTRKQFEIVPELFVGDFRIGLKSKASADDGTSTFHMGGMLGDRVEETAEYTAKYINKVYSGANRTRLAIVESDGTSNFVASKAAGVDVGVTLLNVGMNIEVRDAHAIATGAVRDSLTARRITAIDESTRTVTYSGADQTLVAGDGVYITGSFAREVWTLDDIVDDGTQVLTDFQGLSRTTYPILKANVFGAGGVLRNLSEALLLQACMTPRRKCGKRPTVVMGNEGQARKYAEFVTPDRRFLQSGESDPKYAVGFGDDSLMVVAPGVRAKFEINVDCKPRKVYALTWDTFGLYEGQELDWWDDGGGILKPAIGAAAGTYAAACDAFIASVENQFNIMPIANSQINDLKDDLVGDA